MNHWLFAAALCALGCSSGSNGPTATGTPDDAAIYAQTSELDVPVPDSGRTYVRLAEPGLVDESEKDWDLAFEGYDVFTNGGPSGPGKGEAFGPLDVGSLASSSTPEHPFLSPDKAGGAFLEWYAYDGVSHGLFSRYHVYGVRRGAQLWKVQVLSYYSEQDHAPVSGLYQVRYAALAPEAGPTELLTIDGTAGGVSGGPDSPSGCLDLESGRVTSLGVSDARESRAWDLCFRRDSISVNGEVGGPGEVSAVDLQASEIAAEKLADLKKLTADGELSRFDAADVTAFDGLTFRGDHVVSAFETGVWLEPNAEPAQPVRAAWLVADSLGSLQFMIAFSSFRNQTTASPGTIALHVRRCCND